MSFENKVVIVTGASSGIGAATAKIFASEKAAVVMVGRNAGKLNRVAEEIKENSGKAPTVIIADVAIEDEAKGIVEQTIDFYGKLDVLVNNAGIAAPTSIFHKDCIKDLDRVLATNLRAVAVITHAAVPYLVKTKGNIVNVSSIASTKPVVTHFAYAASKAGLDQFSRCVAYELAAKGVRLNVVNPGVVRTDFLSAFGMTKEQEEQLFEDFAEKNPLQRVSDSEEIGDIILYLASDKARSITGASYTVDCGGSLTSF